MISLQRNKVNGDIILSNRIATLKSDIISATNVCVC